MSSEINKGIGSNVAVALVHHPVVDKTGAIVTTSVTTMDVHDFARTLRTYGVSEFYVVTPLKSQRNLVRRLMKHWCEGFGASRNPHRKEALSTVKIVDTISSMMDNLSSGGWNRITQISTSASEDGEAISFSTAREMIETSVEKQEIDHKYVLLFGTGSGLAPEVCDNARYRLEPIRGASDFNHLPVRCAAAIIIDRLMGRHG